MWIITSVTAKGVFLQRATLCCDFAARGGGTGLYIKI